MNKIRFGFLAIVLIISIAAVITFNVYKNPLDKTVARVSDFKITQVAGSGGLYVDTNPIKKEEIFLASKVDIKQMHYSEDIYAATDRHTAFEFYFSGASFIAMPDSYLNYQPGSNTLRFIEGEFIWHKEIADSPIGVSLVTASQVITLSSEGKVSIKPTGAGIQIWNYAGELKYNDGSATFSLQPNTFLASARNQRPLTASLLEAPGFISPEEKEITVNQPGDSAVKFSWKEVTGARGYIIRVYSSKLMENILYEKEVDANWIGLDLLQFADFNTLYWQVYAYDSSNERQGVPSKMGFLKINGVFFNKESILKPPELKIKTLDVNGNLVLIEGVTDKNSQLYINDTLVTLNPDGTFIHTMHFNKIGKYKITFRVVSPSGKETTLEKLATVYDE